MGRSYQLDAFGLELRDRGIKAVRFQAEVKPCHRAFGAVRELQHSVSELKIGYSRPACYRLHEFLKPK
jgi:hypothetical protein